MALRDDGTMVVVVSLANPVPSEVSALKGRWDWRLLVGPEMPGGLLMFAGTVPGHEPMVFELAFDASLEASHRLTAVLKRLANPEAKEHPDLVPSITGIGVDSAKENRIFALKFIGPPSALVERLAVLWAEQPGQGNYYDHYRKLIATKSLSDLWGEAQPYP